MAVAIGRLLEEINVYEIISLFWCKKKVNFKMNIFLRNFEKCVPPKMVFSQKWLIKSAGCHPIFHMFKRIPQCKFK